MTALELTGVHAGYGDQRILHDLSLTVGDAEVVSVIGPNGAGKSTCLKIVAGLLPWTAGEVRVAGRAVRSGTATDEGRAALGYVPQLKNTFPSLTVRENLLLMAPRTWPRAAAGRRAADLLEEFPALASVAGRSAALLSGGERQLLALAMALVRRPSVLLLDEPAAALSPIATRQVFEIVGGLKAEGIAVLIVEQNARLVLNHSDRCYVLESGTVALEGDAAPMLDDPRLGSLYLGGDLPEDAAGHAARREPGPSLAPPTPGAS
ncbi:ABC transporter ATP-binding protein [Actinomadura welshii]|uniref:ABC transporter ATP-binding protein n=1 Tax=Actinomadura welshii TaxID=3103817 RepID=UPI0003ACDFDD|nr:ABC transporter ATP-binding protein [Actinomadura madurae]